MLEKVLNRSAYRRSFFLVVSLVALVLLLTRYLVLPLVDPAAQAGPLEVIESTLESLLVSLVVTIGIGSFVFWFVPDLDQIAQVKVIGADEIGRDLERAMRGTEIWWFMGGTGRYFRSVTLETISSAARSASSSCHVLALLLDPTDKALCESYAHYRRSLKSGATSDWTAERTQAEVLATILKALHIKQNFPQLRIEVGLRSYFSTFRYDLSSKHVLVTREDPQAPAIRCDFPGHYYSAYKGEVTFAHNQSKQLAGADSTLANQDLSPANARKALENAGMSLTGISDEMLIEAVKLVGDSKSPY